MAKKKMNNSETRKIIAFAGRKRSGKTTLANVIKDYEEKAKIITIADYLKKLCSQLMSMSYEELNEKKDNGYEFSITPDEKWYDIISEATQIDKDLIRKELENKCITNIRQLLQLIGTDVIRKYKPNWHVDKMCEEIEKTDVKTVIAIDDVRFPNEREAIEKLGGKVYFIVRPNPSEVSNHPSETALTWKDFKEDNVILNTSSVVNIFKVEFLEYYTSNLIDWKNPLLLLSNNRKWLEHSDFGYDIEKTDKSLLALLLDQCKNDNLFMKYGIIRYKTCVLESAESYVKNVDSNYILNERNNEFVTYNPLIVENLKKYL